MDLVVSAYAGAADRQTLDGVRIHRHGHWRVANFVLPAAVRRMLRARPYDLLIEDINKIPFYTPLYRAGVPLVVIVPHLFGSSVFRETHPLAAAYVRAGELPLPWLYRGADFEVISASTRDDLVRRGIPAARVRTIHCGLDHGRYRLAEPPPRAANPLVVTWSRLRRYKSVDVAIRAFGLIAAEVPQASLLVMGRGPDEARLRRLAARSAFGDRIEFTGHVARPELVRLLHTAHVCLNTSPKEGWGLTVIEANACGLPVVASNCPGLRDSIRDGETGLLVPYGEPAAFAAAALRLLRDRALWQRLSAAARAWSGTFSWDRCAEESLALFAEARERQLGAGARRGPRSDRAGTGTGNTEERQ